MIDSYGRDDDSLPWLQEAYVREEHKGLLIILPPRFAPFHGCTVEVQACDHHANQYIAVFVDGEHHGCNIICSPRDLPFLSSLENQLE